MTEPTSGVPTGTTPGALLTRHTLLASPPKKPRRGSTLVRHLVLTVVLVLLVLYATDHIDLYYDYLLAQAAAYLCAVAGLTVLIGLNGQVSLGQGALMAIGAYTVAMLQHQFFEHNVTTQWTLLYVLAAGVVVTSVAGLVIGLAAARLRGPYLAGLTLAIVVVVPAIASQYPNVFHGDQGLTVPVQPPPSPMGLALPPEEWQVWFAVIAAAVVMFFLANLVRSRYGRQLRAVRDHEVAAQLAGVHVARTQVVTFVVSAACAGLGGGVFAAVTQAVSPSAYSLTLSLYLLLAIVLGGLGSLAGAVWGSLAVVYLPYLASKAIPENASNLQNNLPPAIFGFVLIVIAISAPGGIQGLLRRAGQLVRPRKARVVAPAQPPESHRLT